MIGKKRFGFIRKGMPAGGTGKHRLDKIAVGKVEGGLSRSQARLPSGTAEKLGVGRS